MTVQITPYPYRCRPVFRITATVSELRGRCELGPKGRGIEPRPLLNLVIFEPCRTRLKNIV